MKDKITYWAYWIIFIVIIAFMLKSILDNPVSLVLLAISYFILRLIYPDLNKILADIFNEALKKYNIKPQNNSDFNKNLSNIFNEILKAQNIKLHNINNTMDKKKVLGSNEEGQNNNKLSGKIKENNENKHKSNSRLKFGTGFKFNEEKFLKKK